MAHTNYAYAVARIRANELQLFSNQLVEQLLATKSYDECLRMLLDKGWGDEAAAGIPTAEELLSGEREKTWALIGELCEDMSPFDVFLYANDYHNLKAAIKLVCTNTDDFGIFIKNGTVDCNRILNAIKDRDFYELPDPMRAPAQEAYSALSQTRDGQLCDIIIDRAALEAILSAGSASDNSLIQKYAELTVASADIKIAARCCRTGKSLEFLRRALAPCRTVNVTLLARATSEGMEAIADYLEGTDYAGAVSELQKSASAFECWCDNLMIQSIKPQQYEVFGIGPLAAYILARENEIKTVRMILSGKLNSLPDAAIRERIREMYV